MRSNLVPILGGSWRRLDAQERFFSGPTWEAFQGPPVEEFSQRRACVAVVPSPSRPPRRPKTPYDTIFSSSDTHHPWEEFSQRRACVAVAASPPRPPRRPKTPSDAIFPSSDTHHPWEEFPQRRACVAVVPSPSRPPRRPKTPQDAILSSSADPLQVGPQKIALGRPGASKTSPRWVPSWRPK